MDNVEPYAEECTSRSFLGGFLQGSIKNAGDPFYLGKTERALVEVSLQAIQQNSSLVIHNPFPTNSLPLAICSSYVYSQHPRIPSAGDKQPMVLFPSTGYVTAFDDFHFRDSIPSDSRKSDVVPRNVVSSLSEIEDKWQLYSANMQEFQFDLDSDYTTPGAAFVDFQNLDWSDTSFERIEEFCETNPEMPTIFYTDKMGAAAELTCTRLGVKPLTITNDLLTTATPSTDDGTPQSGESPLTMQERILADGGVDIQYFSATNEDLAEELPSLIKLKNKLRERNLASFDVSRVFNRLTKQPFKPEYWAQRTSSDGYWDGIPTYIDRIRRRADNVSGAASDYLVNFARTANKVQGILNERHVLQNVVLDAVERAGQSENDVAFVLKNDAEVDSLELALMEEGYSKPSNVSFVEKGNVSPNPDVPHLILYPPYRESYLYEFPPSKNLAFFYNDLWDDYVRQTAEKATQNIKANHSSSNVGDSAPGSVEDFEFDIDEIEGNIKKQLTESGFSGLNTGIGNRSNRDDADREDHSTSDDGGELIVIELSDGITRELNPGSHVTTYNPSSASVSRKTAKNITTDEHLMLIDDAADDIYDVLIDNAHQREAVRKNEALIEDWRTTLNNGMEARDFDAEDVLNELQLMGSDLEDPRGTVEAWQSGDTIAPRKRDDVERVIQLFHPELERSGVKTLTRQVWRAVKHIRGLHQRIGRNVRRVIEAEANPATTASFDGDNVNDSMIRSISQAVERKPVVNIKQKESS